MNILFKISLSTLLFWGWSCSSDKQGGPKAVSFGGGPVVVTPSGDNNAIPSASTEDQSQSLELLQNSGSEMRLLDAYGLQVYYSRIFEPKVYGYEHCAKARPFTSEDCTASIFTASERAELGSPGMFAGRFSKRGRQNINPITSLTLGYSRTLRAGLVRECEKLVTTETTKLAAKDTASNILIKSELPSKETIDEFIRILFGAKGTAITMDVPSALYVEAFNKAIAGVSNKAVGNKEAYINLCISLAMDPSVFLY